jgi:hypothetical protein
MSHFAKVENGIVTQVIVAEQDFVDTQEGTWVQTSYNSRAGVHYGQDGNPDGQPCLRKNFAAIGYIYDSERDAFYPPQPFPSWTLSEEIWDWQPPHAAPIDHENPDNENWFIWDEDAYQADNTAGWTTVTIQELIGE